MNTEQRDNATPELWQSLPNAPGVYLMKSLRWQCYLCRESDPFADSRAFLFSREIYIGVDIADDAVCD